MRNIFTQKVIKFTFYNWIGMLRNRHWEVMTINNSNKLKKEV